MSALQADPAGARLRPLAQPFGELRQHIVQRGEVTEMPINLLRASGAEMFLFVPALAPLFLQPAPKLLRPLFQHRFQSHRIRTCFSGIDSHHPRVCYSTAN